MHCWAFSTPVGTTGFPKGVMLSHTNVSFSAMNSVSTGKCCADARFLHSMPTSPRVTA
nr:AMP-binding protein [Pseudomonas fluorescens]